MTKSETRHPFGELLTQYRARKPGLTQTHLAELAGYDQAILVRMGQGKKDLTGPSGRERVMRLIETLADQGALAMLDEANGLLMAAGMPPLFDRHATEARLIARLARASAHHRVRRTNLPAPLSAFVGRTQEAADVRRLLGETRLLTLTGAGGSGKTRLAQQVAADVLIAYPDGVWYVELAALTDGSSIADSVARVFGLIAAETPVLEQLADFLRERHTLLVLDNCEHLIDAVAGFAVALLRECARLTLLTTSREALNVEGEVAWRVPPMLPDEAARLFVARAALARPGQRFDSDSVIVGQICQRLDGMPLAIELAASRLSAISLSDIAARLDDRFNFLTQGKRGALPRHQTLRAMIDWSYDLLSEPEKIVFRRLGVFVGGWELEQAECVMRDASAIDAVSVSVLTMLTQLVGKSLIVVEERAGKMRYRYLETIRAYAIEKLVQSGEMEWMKQGHAEAFCALAAQAAACMHGHKQLMWVSRLRLEQGNFRAALEWSFGQQGDPLLGCTLVGRLRDFWLASNAFVDNDVRRWVTLATEHLSDDMPADVQAWVWLAADHWLGIVSPFSRRALALFESSGNQIGMLIAQGYVARTLFYELNYPAAIRLHEDAVAQSRELGDEWVLRFNLDMLADGLRFGRETEGADGVYAELYRLDLAEGDLHHAAYTLLYYISGAAKERLKFEEALQHDEEGLRLARIIDNPNLEVQARYQLAEDILSLGDAPRAVALLEDCLAMARERIAGFGLIQTHLYLARAVGATGDYVRARALLNEAVHVALSYGQQSHYLVFDTMAAVAAAQGDAVQCARLRGLVERLMSERHHYRRENLEWEYAPYIAKARAALGDAAYDAAVAEGRAMTHEQAIAYVLDEEKPDSREGAEG